MSMKYDPSIDIGANESNEVFLEALREANEAAKPNPELIKQIQLEGWDSSFYDEPSIKEVIIERLKDISVHGFTFEEFQKAMLLFCIIRFLIYCVKYNVITSFKICGVGFISCVLWGLTLNDCLGNYYPYLKYHPLLTNILYEEDRFRKGSEMRAMRKVSDTMFKRMAGDTAHFTWIQPLFNLVPNKYRHIADPIYNYITEDLREAVIQLYKIRFRHVVPFALYIAWVRIGKKYCPYHVRWNFTFIILYNQIVGFVYEGAGRAQAMITYTLLPQFRFEEAQTVQLYLGTLALVHMGAIMLAMLHCIFSQYFYVPMFTYGAELHCGKRPKNSIYSGGYTAWQDVYTFYDLKFRESMRLWWGWLGRGTKAMRKKNGEDKKKRKRKKK